MRVAGVTDNVRSAPVKALRAIFTGVGQVLVAADRMRTEAAEAQTADAAEITRPTGRAKSEGRAYSHGVGKSKRTEKPKKSVKLKKPGKPKSNAKPKKDGKAKAKGRAAEEAERRWRSLDSTGNVRVLTREDLAPQPAPVATSEPEPPPVAPPIPGYDRLSLASLRARLRTLDTAQLSRMLDYERANAARDDVIGMFERRLTRIETAPGR